MSAHIPEFRRAINGRTFSQTWEPYAGTHHRRDVLRVGKLADRVIYGIGVILAVVAAVHALAVYLGG